jgi:hypothetical protein
MDKETSRAIVTLNIPMAAKVMVKFEQQMRIEGIEPDKKTGRLPFAATIEALLTAYADGLVVIVNPHRKTSKAVAENVYMEAHK